MKKHAFLFFFLAIIIGCKSTGVVSTKLDNKTERLIKGEFTITDVDFAGSDYLKVTSFNISDSKCFIGSNWSFISNNNKGNMELSNSNTNCVGFSSPITWYINKDGNFVLKIIDNYKAKEVNNGFVLKISNVTENSFDLIDNINVAGVNKNITYKFQRK